MFILSNFKVVRVVCISLYNALRLQPSPILYSHVIALFDMNCLLLEIVRNQRTIVPNGIRLPTSFNAKQERNGTETIPMDTHTHSNI